MTEKRKIKEKIYDSRDLIPNEQETIDNVLTETLSREDRFISELHAGHPSVKEAGMAAGYSESYASSGICYKFRSERFLKKLRDYNYSEYHKLLPKLYRIDIKALEHVDEDISRLPKFERTLGTIKRQIGVLDTEGSTTINMVNVEKIQALVHSNHEAKINER